MDGLRELHLLLTYQCTFERDHCFVWGSPNQTGTMTIAQVRRLLGQGRALGTVRSICFEGGEPFLYYATLLEAVREVKARGWRAEAVTNAYWASSLEDALVALRPLKEAGLRALWVSDDAYHGSTAGDSPPRLAARAARDLGLKTSAIAIEPPEVLALAPGDKGRPIVGGGVRFRGRAAVKLTDGLPRRPWQEFCSCPHEELERPTRVHVDPLGFVHLCQGIVLGNAWQRELVDIMHEYDPAQHPMCGPLLQGGPAGLARAFRVKHDVSYVDECHFCFDVRRRLRGRLGEWLAPDQMYGVPEA
jgi:MoaA/NifB/PqqE/SkfB family radical SAM enzyme